MKLKLKNIFILNMFLLITLLGSAQKHDHTWLLGYNSDGGLPGTEIINLNFNETPMSITTESRASAFFVSSAMLSDTSGKLLFYTDGCDVYNSSDEMIENGDGLNPGEVHDIQCDNGVGDGYTAGWQSSLILPSPATDDTYYVVHKKIEYVYEPSFDVVTTGLFYTLVDAKSNEGAGEVLTKNVPIVEQELTYGQIAATKHANGHDWWIVTAGNTNNLYYSALLTSEGIDTVFVSEHEYIFTDGGQANFSPDGQYFARYNSLDGLLIFRFDRTTGLLSDEKFFSISNTTLSCGVAFSPNSQLLYVSAHDTIYQYDMTAPDIGASRQTVAVYDGNTEIFQTTFHTAQLAPDCKIYIGTFANVKTLHVIHNPNERGTACGVEQHALDLPYWHDKTIPYFPNYRLGPLIEGEPAEPPCEGEFVVADEEVSLPEGKAFAVFPNPASHAFTVALDGPLPEEAVFSLYNMAGVQVQSARLESGRHALQVEVGGLPPGLYIGVLRTEAGRLLGRRKVVINRKM
ncbi:MAG: T9SS type A sorting domain-containing protein [Bacteroidetes bacterium]|jgi:hypothetical protein|nr:T9SS type A sorting domain-containing protein [Bacteroidota bacterium]